MTALIDKANIFRLHKALIEKYGNNSKAALGWHEPAGQEARFAIFANIADLNGHTVLDLGCGHADLFAYLIKIYPQLLYMGIEQIPAFLQVAFERYGHYPFVQLFNGDFTQPGLPVSDYTIACGSLSYRSTDKMYILKTIEKLFTNSRIGFGFNLLRKTEQANGFLTAYDPDYITAFCYKLTKHVRLIENYYKEDYSVFMYH